ncbi:hypothetical protein NHQ30_011387 [Ciborinia camelliae]|nr:hypothetical protein NHQ30_011387 [Ciborinia camelliae]
MLPEYLDSTYKRYKEDTSTFIKWLSKTGQSCSYTPNKSSTPIVEPAPKSSRLKGKARKAAKQSSSSLPATATELHPQIVDIKDILPLAKAIIDSKFPAQIVPISIIQAGLRAISARRKCTSFFVDLTAENDIQGVQSNESHEFFTDLMDEVLTILQPLFEVVTGATSTTFENTKTPSEDIKNRFAQLEVEDTIEDTQNDFPAATRSKSIESPDADYELGISDSKAYNEEKMFALICLFKDLQKLRSFIDGIWKDYDKENIDLITAAATTNAAFQLGIRAQEEVAINFPGLDDYDQAFTMMFSIEYPESKFRTRGTLGDFIFASTYNILRNFCHVLQPDIVPAMNRGCLGVYNPLANRSKMSFNERYKEDWILLYELLPEFALIAKDDYLKGFRIDELTKGISKMCLSKNISVWLSFATTVLLDIHHSMRERVALGYRDMQIIAQRLKTTLDKHIKFSRNVTHPAGWCKNEIEKRIEGLATKIEESIITDAILNTKRKRWMCSDGPELTPEENFYLYRHHPILSGFMAFYVTLNYQKAGLSYCNIMGTVTFPAQLYNALKQKPDPVSSWPLMDQAIAMHTLEQLFFGCAPKTMQACFRQLCLIGGFSPALFAANRRSGGGISTSKNGGRVIKQISPISELFYQGFLKKSMAFTLHNIENLLNDQARDQELAQHPDNKSLKYEWSRTKRLSSIQFLEALKTEIPHELAKVNFNYFNLHQESVKLLLKLEGELEVDVEKELGPSTKGLPPRVCFYILREASKTERRHEKMGLKVTSSLLLDKAGGIFEDFLRNIKDETSQN